MKKKDREYLKVYAQHSHNPVSDLFVQEMKGQGIKTTKGQIAQLLGYTTPNRKRRSR